MIYLSVNDPFPTPEEMDPSGLIAVGGDLSPSRLLNAYRNGIFPWYEEDSPILWWSPDPRCVLFPEELKISKSMRQVLKKPLFSFSVNHAFKEVISHCSKTIRKNQEGTWITNDMKMAYCKMHALGYAHSAEAWMGNKLVGGLYGIRLDGVFFGESMFSKESNASKFAFIQYVQLLKKEGVRLIDCQVESEHLLSLGARLIPRNDFNKMLHELI